MLGDDFSPEPKGPARSMRDADSAKREVPRRSSDPREGAQGSYRVNAIYEAPGLWVVQEKIKDDETQEISRTRFNSRQLQHCRMCRAP